MKLFLKKKLKTAKKLITHDELMEETIKMTLKYGKVPLVVKGEDYKDYDITQLHFEAYRSYRQDNDGLIGLDKEKLKLLVTKKSN